MKASEAEAFCSNIRNKFHSMTYYNFVMFAMFLVGHFLAFGAGLLLLVSSSLSMALVVPGCITAFVMSFILLLSSSGYLYDYHQTERKKYKGNEANCWLFAILSLVLGLWVFVPLSILAATPALTIPLCVAALLYFVIFITVLLD